MTVEICLSRADLSVNNVAAANQNRSVIYLVRDLLILLMLLVNIGHLGQLMETHQIVGANIYFC